MHDSRERSHSDRLGQDGREVRAAVRFAVVAAVCGVGYLVMAALWVSTCSGTDLDTAACGPPERTLLAIGAPLILFVAGLWAFVRTYRVWRDQGIWWAWHGAGWFLFTVMMLTLAMGFPPILGPVLAG
ncbi:hypothetical protein [Mycobacterium sp.]|uniref:hypothetical protein n=1 Tax=Mycobacterium sp. TaxID=1785 RepID=UPI003BAB4C33